MRRAPGRWGPPRHHGPVRTSERERQAHGAELPLVRTTAARGRPPAEKNRLLHEFVLSAQIPVRGVRRDGKRATIIHSSLWRISGPIAPAPEVRTSSEHYWSGG